MKILQIISLILVFATIIFAQKVVSVDSEKFFEKQDGIKLLVVASGELSYFTSHWRQSTKELTDRIEILDKEIFCLKSENKNFEYKELEEKKLKDKLEFLQKDMESRHQKLRSLLVTPVIEKIRAKLKEFAKQKGYVIVVEQSSINEGVIICGEITDITKEFIKFCNEEFEKEKTQNK